MSIFKPNNLSPNFEEVIVERTDSNDSPALLNELQYQFINGNKTPENRGKIAFTFDVHTKMSYIRSYRLTIMDENATQENKEKYILGEFYGVFENFLKDGDKGVVYITYNELLNAGIEMIPGEKYIWEIRLYEDIIGTDIDFALNENGSITINKQIISAEEAKEKYGIIVEEKNNVKYLEFSNLFNNSNLNIGNIASGFNNVSIYSDDSFIINPVIDNNYKNDITISDGETKINLKGYNKFTFSS